MAAWTDISNVVRAITERARRVDFRGESPSEEWNGRVELMCDANGNMCLHVERAHFRKYSGKKWHTQSIYVTLSGEAWEHLRATPTEVTNTAA